MIGLGIYVHSNTIIILHVFLLGYGFYSLKRIISNAETVVVNEKGISSRVNKMGLVKWEYIKAFEIKDAINSKVLVVYINDHEKLLSEMNRVSKILMKTNIKRLGSPVIIPESEFNDSLYEVKKRIEEYKNSL